MSSSSDVKEDGQSTCRRLVYDREADYSSDVFNSITHATLPLRGGNTLAYKGIFLFLSALPSLQHLQIILDEGCEHSTFPNLNNSGQTVFPHVRTVEIKDDFGDELNRVSFRHDVFPNLQILIRTFDPEIKRHTQADTLRTCSCTETNKTTCRFAVSRKAKQVSFQTSQ